MERLYSHFICDERTIDHSTGMEGCSDEVETKRCMKRKRDKMERRKKTKKRKKMERRRCEACLNRNCVLKSNPEEQCSK